MPNMEASMIQWNKAEVAYPVREESRDGKEFVVVPVVALLEGVHSGSLGATYYSPEVIAQSVNAWNGMPIVIQHPEKDGKPITANTPEGISRSPGRMYNATFDEDGAKLKGELWFEKEKTARIAPQVLTAIEAAQALEVSTGHYGIDEEVQGSWAGKPYDRRVLIMQPDHIALLPDGIGACSLADGCGLGVNKKQGGIMTKLQALVATVAEKLGWNEEQSLDDKQRAVRQAVNSLDNDSWSHWTKETYDDYVIYESEPKQGNPSVAGSSTSAKLYKRSYSMDAEGTVTLADDAQEVREETAYVVLSACDQRGVDEMDLKERVSLLIACDQTKFTENEREWLEGMTAEQLDALGPKVNAEEQPPPDPPEDPPPPDKEGDTEETVEEADPDGSGPPQTMEQVLASLPSEVSGTIRRAVARDQAIKEKLIGALVANKACKFTKTELAAKDISELEKISELARVEVDYSAQAGAPVENADPYAAPPVTPIWDLSKKSA